MNKYVSIFGSYKPQSSDKEYKVAYEISFELAKKGYTILNGGGSGIMEASSKGTNDADGKSIGIILGNSYTIPKQFNNNEIIVCKTLFERLQKLIENSNAFIVFSGGTGTLTELSLIWELENKNQIKKVPIICYGDFWRPVIDNLKNNEYYIKRGSIDLIQFAYSKEEILAMI